jgi:hypothetical protein
MTITYRTTKGSALTYGEVDENFRDLLEDTTIDRVLGNGNSTTKDLTVGSLTIGAGTPGGSGNPGQIAWDSGFIYICVAPGTWKKAALVDL